MSRNYVKSLVKSGTSATLLDVSPLKAGAVTQYNLGAFSLFPENAALYYYNTRPDYQPTSYLLLCIVGSNSKTLVINHIGISVKGILNVYFAAPNNKVSTYKIEITRANFTGSTVPSYNWADSEIIKADSASANPSGAIRVSPTGLTNQEVLFSSYHKCELNSVPSAGSFFNPSAKIPYGMETGKGIRISGSTELLMFPITMISGSMNDLFVTINVSWYEI